MGTDRGPSRRAQHSADLGDLVSGVAQVHELLDGLRLADALLVLGKRQRVQLTQGAAQVHDVTAYRRNFQVSGECRTRDYAGMCMQHQAGVAASYACAGQPGCVTNLMLQGKVKCLRAGALLTWTATRRHSFPPSLRRACLSHGAHPAARGGVL